jgi:4-hydroxy-3-polyprenylbenzoate decarboxylase
MPYRTLRECLDDLAASGRLVRIESEVDPHLEAAEIHRRVQAVGGPALYFARVKGCRFPLCSNLFGTLQRARWLFRDTLAAVERLVRLKIDPAEALRHPGQALAALPDAWRMRPRLVGSGPVLAQQCTIRDLPQLQCWPRDGGAYVLLPQVYTEDPDRPGWQQSNLGMYRVQLSGGEYAPDREIGLHYQIHRGIGIHHAAAIRRGEPLRVNIFVGGPPAMTLAAVMPLPEGLSELTFAGVLGGRRVPLVSQPGGLPVHAEADFCIAGTVDPGKLLPEGPFGDHLGYYSLAHDFPVLRVEHVWHRADAVWPFTVVGRPPQEDTAFGQLIHELTGPAIPSVVRGVRAVHAVDAAGVHPLLLAVGSERYTPYERERRPQEILTQANALLGQGQLSLAKYLLIAAGEDDPQLDIHDVAAFLAHVLARFDPQRDLHFQTSTTIDTLDYSGTGLNAGSKLVMAAAGPRRRELPTVLPADLRLPEGLAAPRVCLPGVLAVEGPRFAASAAGGVHGADLALARLLDEIPLDAPLCRFPLVVVADDAGFTSASLSNFLWVTFTRSNPAADVYGVRAFVQQKHWGCRGSLVIDARTKPHHAPPLEPDPEVARRVESLAAQGGPLHGII